MNLHCFDCGGDAIEPGEAGAPSHCANCLSTRLVREWPLAAPAPAPANTFKKASVEKLLNNYGVTYDGKPLPRTAVDWFALMHEVCESLDAKPSDL